MTSEKEHKLATDFPEIFKHLAREYEGNMYIGIACADGWYDLIYTLCFQIDHHIKWSKKDPVRATQVKEKFGGLRFYVDGTDEHVQGLIRMAESMSYKLCEFCGCPAARDDEGYFVPTMCAACKNKKRD